MVNVPLRSFQFIRKELSESGWIVSLDTFTESTVIGNKTFTNIVAVNRPHASRRIVLSCHYESKLMLNFYGTIDSAVPCSIIVNIAESLIRTFQSSEVRHFYTTCTMPLCKLSRFFPIFLKIIWSLLHTNSGGGNSKYALIYSNAIFLTSV